MLKAQETFFNCCQRLKIVRRKHFSLNNREINFDLIEPTGMNGCVNQDGVGPTALQTLGRSDTTMRRTVVDDPKDTACGAVRFLNHDLIHKAAESSAAIGRFTVSENPGVMDIPSRQIDPSTEAF